MSADRWVVCPRCKLNAEAEHGALMDRANEAYGNAPAAEYEELMATARKPVSLDTTLREDYEFYLSEEGAFSAEFGAGCETCGFTFTFKHEEQVKVAP